MTAKPTVASLSSQVEALVGQVSALTGLLQAVAESNTVKVAAPKAEAHWIVRAVDSNDRNGAGMEYAISKVDASGKAFKTPGFIKDVDALRQIGESIANLL